MSPSCLSRKSDEVRRDPEYRDVRGGPGRPVEGRAPGKGRSSGCDAVCNLAGQNLFADPVERRVQATDPRQPGLRGRERGGRDRRGPSSRPKVLVQGSAVGYYGPRDDEDLTESSPSGSDFLAVVCRELEEAASQVEAARRPTGDGANGGRPGPKGEGALGVMTPLFKLGRSLARRQWRKPLQAREGAAVDELDSHRRHPRPLPAGPRPH